MLWLYEVVQPSQVSLGRPCGNLYSRYKLSNQRPVKSDVTRSSLPHRLNLGIDGRGRTNAGASVEALLGFRWGSSTNSRYQSIRRDLSLVA